LATGHTTRQVDTRLASGLWEITLPRVYRFRGSARTKTQGLWAASLWGGPGAVLSHETAAVLWRLRDSAAAVELSLASGRASRAHGIVLHRTTEMPDVDRRVVDGLAVTSPARTLIDLAPRLDDEGLEVMFERARHRGLLSVDDLDRRVAALGGAGRPGSTRLRRLLALQQPGDAALESPLEVKVWRLLRRSTMPLPVRQHWVATARGNYRLDLAWPDRHVAIECDGWDAHGGRVAWKRDRRRLGAVGAMGWRLIPVTWDDVTREPRETLALIEQLLGQPQSQPQPQAQTR
jgi:very-short-patch-repair endonuclease